MEPNSGFQRPSIDDLLRVRPQIEAALAHGDGCFAFTDIVALVLAGRFQMWAKGESVILTEIAVYPRKKVCLAFLAAGNQRDLSEMTPLIEQWATAQGCREGWVTGRKGWARSYLEKQGWTLHEKVTMYKALGAP